MELKEKLDLIIQEQKSNDRISIFKDVVDRLGMVEIQCLIQLFLDQDEWLTDKIVSEKYDENWMPFMKSVFVRSSSITQEIISKAINNLTGEILIKDEINEVELYYLYQVIDLVNYLNWGMSDDWIKIIFQISIDSEQWSSIQELAGVALASYPLTDDRKAFWKSVDLNKNKYLIYPYLLALRNEPIEDVYGKLSGTSSPPIHSDLESISLKVLEAFESGIAAQTHSVAQFLRFKRNLPGWLARLVEHLTEEFSDSFSEIAPLVLLDFDWGLPGSIFNNFKYIKEKSQQEYYYLKYPIYDLDILELIDLEGLAKTFGVTLKGFGFHWKNYKLEVNGKMSTKDSSNEIESHNLLDQKFVKNNPNNFEFKGNDRFSSETGNLLIVIPRQLISAANKKLGTEIAITNLFQTSFVINTSLAELFFEDEDFHWSNLPNPDRGQNDIANQLYALWAKKYVCAGYDAEGYKAFDILLKFIYSKYSNKFSRQPRMNPLSIDGGFLSQDELKDLLSNRYKGNEKILVITTAPVLAHAHNNGATFLFNLDDIRGELKAESDYKELRAICEAYIHTTLVINIPATEYESLIYDQKREVQRLFSMIMYAVTRIKNKTKSYAEFIEEKIEANSNLGIEAIKFALDKSYVYNHPDSYDTWFYKDNAYFAIKDSSTSNDIFYDNKEKFDNILSSMELCKNDALRTLKFKEFEDYLMKLYNELISSFRKERYFIDIFHFEKEIINAVKKLLGDTVEKFNRVGDEKNTVSK